MKIRTRLTVLFTAILLTVSASGFAAGKAQITGVVNINSASKEQLLQLPGIGEAKADAIITQRQQKPFNQPADLLVVRGIGDKMLTKMMPFVTTHGETTVQHESVAKMTESGKTTVK